MTRTTTPIVALAALLGMATAAGCGGAVDRAETLPATSATADTSTPQPPGRPEAAARELVAYAEGAASAVPWAERVRWSISDQEIGTLHPAGADRRRSWTGCPTGAGTDEPTYEGRDCPVSVLRTLADSGLEVFEDTAPQVVGCTSYRVPVVAGTVATTWIRPEQQDRDCFGDYAVGVSVDTAGRVVGVDLALSGP